MRAYMRLTIFWPFPLGRFFARSMGIELKLNLPVEKLGNRPSILVGGYRGKDSLEAVS